MAKKKVEEQTPEIVETPVVAEDTAAEADDFFADTPPVKKDKAYNAVFLENQYIKVMVLPELGGRIQRAYDKTNDYDFVY